MNVRGLEDFNDDPRLAAALAEATKLLESELGRSASTTTAEWSRAADLQGRERIDLVLSDWTGSRSTSFARDELFEKLRLEGRFIRFWGDFLQQSSHWLLSPILRSIQEFGGN